jgi:hypothetical protein
MAGGALIALLLLVGVIVVVTIYVLWRTWGSREVLLDMSEGEGATVQAAVARGRVTRDATPSGALLLSLGAIERLGIYTNGIYARFCTATTRTRGVYDQPGTVPTRTALVGRAKCGFVHFKNISGVFPITVERFESGRRESSYEDFGLQVETVDLRTAYLGPDRDKGEVLDAMRRALGPRFTEIYQEHMMLRGSLENVTWTQSYETINSEGDAETEERTYSVIIAGGDLHRHEMLRRF